MNAVQRRCRVRRGPLTLPAGKHRLRGQFVGTSAVAPVNIASGDGIEIHFDRGSKVTATGATGGVGFGDFNSDASLGTSAGTLTAPCTIGATTLATSGTLTVGWHWVANSTLTHTDTTASDAGGELIYVSSVNGTTATLSTPILGGYAGGVAIRKITRTVSSNAIISGLDFTGVRSSSTQGIAIGLAYNVQIKDCKIDGAVNQSVYLWKCRKVNISNVRATGIGAGVGNGYGVNPNQCQDVTIRNLSVTDSRMAISLAKDCVLVDIEGVVAVGGATVVGGTYTAGSILQAGFDDHDGSRRVKIRNLKTDAEMTFGNLSWRRAMTGYDVANCQAEFLSFIGDFQSGTFTNVSTTAINISASSTAGGWVNRFIGNTFDTCTVAARSQNLIARAINGGATAIEIGTNVFIDSVITGYGANPVIRFDNQGFASPPAYTFQFDGCTLTSGNEAGSRIIQLRGSTGSTGGEIRFEFKDSALIQIAGTATIAALSYSNVSGGVKWASDNSTVKLGAAAPVAMAAVHFGTSSAAWDDAITVTPR